MRNVDEITSLSNRTHFWFTSTPFLAILSISIGFKPYNFNRTQTFFQINTLKFKTHFKPKKLQGWVTLKYFKLTKIKRKPKKEDQKIKRKWILVSCIKPGKTDKHTKTNTQSRKQHSVWVSTHPLLAV